MATNTSNANTNKEANTEARKHYYIALLDTSTNEVRFAPNTIKGRKTLAEMQNENPPAFLSPCFGQVSYMCSDGMTLRGCS